MTYQEYSRAANKHRVTCKYILQVIEKGEVSKDENQYLVLNLYYLSGYIIECAIKYGIYKLKAQSLSQSTKDIVNSEQCKKFAFKMHKHKFHEYYGYLDQQLSDTLPTREETYLQTLYAHWNAEVRYYVKEMPKGLKELITAANVKQFYDYAEQVLIAIERKSKGRAI